MAGFARFSLAVLRLKKIARANLLVEKLVPF